VTLPRNMGMPPRNMGMPSLRRFVSPFRRTLLRSGSSPRSAPCCAELCTKHHDPSTGEAKSQWSRGAVRFLITETRSRPALPTLDGRLSAHPAFRFYCSLWRCFISPATVFIYVMDSHLVWPCLRNIQTWSPSPCVRRYRLPGWALLHRLLWLR